LDIGGPRQKIRENINRLAGKWAFGLKWPAKTPIVLAERPVTDDQVPSA
jgi:hypothetical protein